MDAQTHFGRYKVKATLGHGEMGTVYLAEDPAIGRQVAIKTLRRPPGGAQPADDEARERFDREMRVTGTFTHPNIITVYDVGLEEEEAFIAMAYVDGGSLGSLLSAEHTLPFDRIIELTSQIASGLDYAHENGVVHRDIKPTNILITGEGAPMVSDFGVARMAGSTLTRQGAACGSPAYMSPEQAATQEVTGASDQFSLAIMTYEMLTGELPFSGQSFVTVVYQILQQDPVPPQMINPLVPPAAGEVLLRALSKLPSARYPNCTAFADAFAEALVGSADAPGVPVENLGAAGSPAQLAATVVTQVGSGGQPRDTATAQALRPLRAALTSARAGVSRRLRATTGIELLSGSAALASRFTSANRRPLLIAAIFVVVLAAGMWLGTQLRGGGSTGETEPSAPVTENAIATVPPDILRRPTAASEATDNESGEAIPLMLMRPPASASVPQEADTEPAGAPDQETATAIPQAADETPDPVPETPTAVPEAPDPAVAAPDPAPEEPEPGPADPDTEPAGPDDPAVVTATDAEVVGADAEVAGAETNVPESRWTIVAAGTVPDKLVERAVNATTVLDEIMSAPDQGIPSALLDEAKCVAVIPNVKKVGFIFGTRYGRGLVSCRTEGQWGRPSFVSISGGSFGLQIGARSTDFVLLFANQEAADRLLGDKFTLGEDASVSAGPVGETAEAGTDPTLQTEIYAYSRSRGLFAGVALEGASLATDEDANEDVYGDDIATQELLFNDSGRLPEELATFVQTLAAMAAG